MVMVAERPMTEEERRQGVMFDNVQAAAEYLHTKAEQQGVDPAIIQDIEYIGDCDGQSRTRIERYCAELDLDSNQFQYPGR